MDGIVEYNAFVGLHSAQLESSAVPEYFWYTIYKKLTNEIFDAGEQFIMAQFSEDEKDKDLTIVMNNPTGMKCHDKQHVYIIDHAWTFELREAVLQLRSVPSLLKRMANLVGLNIELETDKAVEEVFHVLWKFLRPYSQVIRVNEPPTTFWYVMDEFGSCIKHSSMPNCRAVPFYHHGDNNAYTLLFPIKDIDENEEIFIDFVEGVGQDDLKSRDALLIPWTGQSFACESEVQDEPDDGYFTSGALLESIPETHTSTLNQRPVLKVFSEYTRVNEFLTDPGFLIVDNENEADVLWLTRHFTDFSGLNTIRPDTFINQFPCERVLTTKDLLAIVCRRGGSPSWLPVTYNLITELPSFVGVFQRRELAGLDNHWICKPWNLARALDTTVTNDLNCILRLPFSGPKIAQKYADRPVLFHRDHAGLVKFDVRYVVLLQSVTPLKLFAYKKFFLRFSNKQFDLNDLWDYEKHFTVMNYREGSHLHRLLCDEFMTEFERQYPQLKWEDVERKLLLAVKEAFERACCEPPPRGLANYPRSRALYAVDMLLTWDQDDIQPLLLEINFGPDCDRACDYYPNFYNDVFNLLFKNVVNPSQFHTL